MLEQAGHLAPRLAAAFLMGSVPFAIVAMWGTGIDIRRVGSGNPGFNNVLRVNKARAVLCLAGDLGKGMLAVLLLHPAGEPIHAAWMIGFATMLGHCYSPWLRFNGGKGIATSAGVMLVLYPAVAALCAVGYVGMRLAGRRNGWPEEGAIASLTCFTLFTVLVFAREGAVSGVLAALMQAIVMWRHKDNVRRLASGRPVV